jgi:hypothetical protein
VPERVKEDGRKVEVLSQHSRVRDAPDVNRRDGVQTQEGRLHQMSLSNMTHISLTAIRSGVLDQQLAYPTPSFTGLQLHESKEHVV